jgi:hypothetical protein
MTNNVISISGEFLDTLNAATVAYRTETRSRPDAKIVVDALLQAEKSAKQQKIIYPFPSMLGKWRLCFTTGTKKVQKRGGIALGKGFYIPKFATAKIAFSANAEQDLGRGEIINSAELGFFKLEFSGFIKYLGKKNILAFDFEQIQLCLFNRTIYQGKIKGKTTLNQDFSNQALPAAGEAIAKLPFFAFFVVTDDFIAARGRGGGLALWIRE